MTIEQQITDLAKRFAAALRKRWTSKTALGLQLMVAEMEELILLAGEARPIPPL